MVNYNMVNYNMVNYNMVDEVVIKIVNLNLIHNKVDEVVKRAPVPESSLIKWVDEDLGEVIYFKIT